MTFLSYMYANSWNCTGRILHWCYTCMFEVFTAIKIGHRGKKNLVKCNVLPLSLQLWLCQFGRLLSSRCFSTLIMIAIPYLYPVLINKISNEVNIIRLNHIILPLKLALKVIIKLLIDMQTNSLPPPTPLLHLQPPSRSHRSSHVYNYTKKKKYINI